MTELANKNQNPQKQSRRSEDIIYKQVLGYLLDNLSKLRPIDEIMRSEVYITKELNISWVILMRMVRQGLLNVDFQEHGIYYYADNRHKKAAETAYWALKGGSSVKDLKLPEYIVYLANQPIKKTTADGHQLSIVGVRMERMMTLLGTVKTPEGEVYNPWVGRTPLPITALTEVERNTSKVIGMRRRCKVIDIWRPL